MGLWEELGIMVTRAFQLGYRVRLYYHCRVYVLSEVPVWLVSRPIDVWACSSRCSGLRFGSGCLLLGLGSLADQLHMYLLM